MNRRPLRVAVYAIARDGMGRRVNVVDPSRSLVLLKPTLGVPHEGGHRLEAGSVDYQILKQWLARGAPPPAKSRSARSAPARAS